MISPFDNLKISLVILLVLLSFSSFSQKWSYQGHDKTKKFGHEYWFSFQNEEDVNSYNLSYEKLIEGSNNLEIILRNNKKEPLPFVTVQIRRDFSDSSTFLISDSNGKITITEQVGEIEITISTFSYDYFQCIFYLKQSKSLNLTINLGKGPELKVYQINSKRKLSDAKVEEIIECVKNGRRQQPSFGCERKRKYNITIHA